MNKIFGCVAAVGFFLLYGAVGALDADAIPVSQFIARMFFSLLLASGGMAGLRLTGKRSKSKRRTNVRAVSAAQKHCA